LEHKQFILYVVEIVRSNHFDIFTEGYIFLLDALFVMGIYVHFLMALTLWKQTNITMIEGDAFALTHSHTLVDSISSCRRGLSEFDVIVSYIIAHLSLHFNFEV
jgi:hypothetical protein